MLQPISAAVLAILSSSRASVRNGGHARIKEDVASAFLGSSAAPGTIAGPILVSLPSNQQRSQFRRPAVSHSPQWWAHSNGGGHCPYPPPSSVRKSISAAVCVHNGRLTRMEKDIASAQYLASGVCYSFVQQSSRAVPWTVPLPTTQQCWPICHTAVHGGPIGLEEDSAFANHRAHQYNMSSSSAAAPWCLAQ